MKKISAAGPLGPQKRTKGKQILGKCDTEDGSLETSSQTHGRILKYSKVTMKIGLGWKERDEERKGTLNNTRGIIIIIIISVALLPCPTNLSTA